MHLFLIDCFFIPIHSLDSAGEAPWNLLLNFAFQVKYNRQIRNELNLNLHIKNSTL
jgi:hypothetical protein